MTDCKMLIEVGINVSNKEYPINAAIVFMQPNNTRLRMDVKNLLVPYGISPIAELSVPDDEYCVLIYEPDDRKEIISIIKEKAMVLNPCDYHI